MPRVRATRPATPRTPRQAVPVPTERQEQKWLIQWCDQNAHLIPALGRVYAIMNAGGYSGGFAANKLRVIEAVRQGVRKGYPDIGLDVARGGYHGLRIEIKRERGGTTAPEQREWHEWLREQGLRVEVCKGFEEARDVLLEYLGAQ